MKCLQVLIINLLEVLFTMEVAEHLLNIFRQLFLHCRHNLVPVTANGMVCNEGQQPAKATLGSDVHFDSTQLCHLQAI